MFDDIEPGNAVNIRVYGIAGVYTQTVNATEKIMEPHGGLRIVAWKSDAGVDITPENFLGFEGE